MEKYQEIKKRHADELETLPIFWAFGDKQLKEGLESFGLTTADVGQIWSIGHGGYMRRTESHLLHEMMSRHNKESQACIDADQTGEGFIFDMFNIELGNHEYCITHDEEDALAALGLDHSDIEKDPRLKHGLQLAINENWREI